jgi:hypothetical protein
MPRNLSLGLPQSLFLILLAICLALSSFNLAFWLLTVAVLLPPTSGTAFSPFVSHVGLSLLRSLQPHAPIGSLAHLESAPASCKPFPVRLHPTGLGVSLHPWQVSPIISNLLITQRADHCNRLTSNCSLFVSFREKGLVRCNIALMSLSGACNNTRVSH